MRQVSVARKAGKIEIVTTQTETLDEEGLAKRKVGLDMAIANCDRQIAYFERRRSEYQAELEQVITLLQN